MFIAKRDQRPQSHDFKARTQSFRTSQRKLSMWCSPSHISPKQEYLIKVLGRALFICQRLEHMFARYSVITEYEKLRGDGVADVFKKAWEIHKRKSSKQKIDSVKGMIPEFDAELYHQARTARNYLMHHSMPFVEAMGNPSEDDFLLDDIEKELDKIRQAVATVLEAEDDVNRQDFYLNSKDSYPPLWTKDYVSHMLRWVFDSP